MRLRVLRIISIALHLSLQISCHLRHPRARSRRSRLAMFFTTLRIASSFCTASACASCQASHPRFKLPLKRYRTTRLIACFVCRARAAICDQMIHPVDSFLWSIWRTWLLIVWRRLSACSCSIYQLRRYRTSTRAVRYATTSSVRLWRPNFLAVHQVHVLHLFESSCSLKYSQLTRNASSERSASLKRCFQQAKVCL